MNLFNVTNTRAASVASNEFLPLTCDNGLNFTPRQAYIARQSAARLANRQNKLDRAARKQAAKRRPLVVKLLKQIRREIATSPKWLAMQTQEKLMRAI